MMSRDSISWYVFVILSDLGILDPKRVRAMAIACPSNRLAWRSHVIEYRRGLHRPATHSLTTIENAWMRTPGPIAIKPGHASARTLSLARLRTACVACSIDKPDYEPSPQPDMDRQPSFRLCVPLELDSPLARARQHGGDSCDFDSLRRRSSLAIFGSIIKLEEGSSGFSQ